jgi:hypothetical protein
MKMSFINIFDPEYPAANEEAIQQAADDIRRLVSEIVSTDMVTPRLIDALTELADAAIALRSRYQDREHLEHFGLSVHERAEK